MTHLELLEYALEGAKTRRGHMQRGDEWGQVDLDIAELERRIRASHAQENRPTLTLPRKVKP